MGSLHLQHDIVGVSILGMQLTVPTMHIGTFTAAYATLQSEH